MTGARRWQVLACMALVQFAIVTDTTIVNVALPDMGAALGVGQVSLGWVVNAYLVVAGSLLLLGGRLADRLGRLQIFLAGASIFGVASIACATASSSGILVAARAAQGLGEALASPAALSILTLLFPEAQERAKALGIWGGLAGLGACVGVTGGGALVSSFGWQSVFWINVPVVAASVTLIPLLLPSRHFAATRAELTGPLDLPGAALLTAGSVCLLNGTMLLARSGLTIFVPMGVLLLVTFAYMERRTQHPLIPGSFFKSRRRLAANTVSALVTGSMASMFFVLTLLQQQSWHRSALATGLSYLPFCVLFVAAVFMSMLLIRLLGEAGTVAVSCMTVAVGMGMLVLGLGHGDNLGLSLQPPLVVLALGFGMAMPALQGAAMSELNARDAGLGAGVQTTVQSFGNAAGVAMSVVLATHFGKAVGGGASDIAIQGTKAVLVCCGLVMVTGAVLTRAMQVPRNQAFSTPPIPQGQARS